MALCAARGEDTVAIKTAGISAMALKKGIRTTGVKLQFYPRKEYVALSTEQKDELKEFAKSAAGQKQKAASKAQGGGRPSKKQKTNNNTNEYPNPNMSQKQLKKIASAVVKLGQDKAQVTSKFDKGLENISSILVNSAAPAQVGGVEAEVSDAGAGDTRVKKKVAQVGTVLKSIMHTGGKKSKKNNGDSDSDG